MGSKKTHAGSSLELWHQRALELRSILEGLIIPWSITAAAEDSQSQMMIFLE
jgi:hypothetical protein